MSILQNVIGTTTQKMKLDGTNAVDMPISDLTDPSGAASPNFVNIVRGGFTFSTVGFAGGSGSTKEFRTYRVELAHDCDPAKGYEVHFRATPSTDLTGNVKMFIEYGLQKKAANFITGATVVDILPIVANGNTDGTEYYFSFHLTTASTGLATMAKGDSFLINICRKANEVEDTYDGSMNLIEFGVHGFTDSTGEQFGD